MKYLLLLALAGGCCFAQRTVTLTWTDTQNPTGTTYSVKRATGLCSGTPTFSTVATAVTTKTYSEPVAVGNYCYVVTSILGAIESAPSNSAGATALPFPPTLGTITVAGYSGDGLPIDAALAPISVSVGD